MLHRIALVLGLFLGVSTAFGQSVQQSGNVTRNHATIWNSNGVVQDGGTAADSPVSTFGVDGQFCVMSDRATAAGRNLLCLQAATNGPATLTLQNYGTASPQPLNFILNGVTLTLPSGGGTLLTGIAPFTVGDALCINNVVGILQDCGVSIAAGNLGGVPTYSATGHLTSTNAPTAGQMLVGQPGSAAVFESLSGDVTSVTAPGAVTLGKVNGIPFASTYAANGVLIGEGTNQFHAVSTLNVGQCLLSQGASDPIWSACSSGSGSAGGSNTQVQFNNSTALAGSANFTWVSPALTLGLAGSVTGQLALAPAGSGTGTVTVQNPSTVSAYNFNLPTAAGSPGQPLLSGGGGSTAMSFGTLGVGGGGTNCVLASGTCLDNITGFASTGFVQRTGSGSYAFSLVVPPSSGGTGLASGTSGGILGFTGSTTIASSGLLANNGVMIGGGAGATPSTITPCTNGQLVVGATSSAPACQTMSGDIGAINSSGAVTIANSAITVAKQANANAFTLEGNFTGSSAAPQFSTIGALTQKASPASNDLILLQDQAASGALKFATVSSVASAGSVASVGGLTGAIGLTSSDLATSGSNIQLSNARRTLSSGCAINSTGATTCADGSAGANNGTYTTPTGALWLEVELVGGGGGGCGSGTTPGAGGTGTATTFGTGPLLSSGTTTSCSGAGSGIGATPSGGFINKTGGNGASGSGVSATSGGAGCVGPYGGGGAAGAAGAGAGGAAAANSGSGGGGGGVNTTVNGGGGGGCGGFLRAIIQNPNATYAYTIGTGGAGGTAGSGPGAPGGAGGSGYIQIIPHFN